MNDIIRNSFDIGYMEDLSSRDSFLHRLDARAKLITTLAFISIVVSFNKYTLSALVPFFVYPVVLISLGGLPFGYFARKILVISPFAVLVGIFNPFIDRDILFFIGPIGISGGWVSFLSIILRFILTVSAALVLVSLTGFNSVCAALMKLGLPKPFVVQLLFFYRYIFVLTDESERMFRAYCLRSFNSGAVGFKFFVSLIGNLLLRTFDRAERIYRAMCCRGFDGHIRVLQEMKAKVTDIGFIISWVFLFILFRLFNLPLIFGRFINGLVQ